MTTPTLAVAYYRTSSVSGLGDNKDSESRQRDACNQFAANNNIHVTKEFYDAAVRGTDQVMDRDGFSEMLEFMVSNNISTILVENASRFARDVLVQITGHDYLRRNNINLIPVDCPQHFTDENPTAEMVRNILAVVSQFEKKSLVEKMRKARERQRHKHGRCEGRKPAPQEAISLATDLRNQGHTYRAISTILSSHGYNTRSYNADTKEYITTSKPYGPQSIKAMLTFVPLSSKV